MSIGRQVLIYPSLDYTLSQPSVVSDRVGYLLERDRILWAFDCYLQNAEQRQEISPAFMPITDAYPATLIVTAEHCPLRDEGIVYADRLAAAGVTCEHTPIPGMIHAFLNLEDVAPSQCRGLYERLGAFLNA